MQIVHYTDNTDCTNNQILHTFYTFDVICFEHIQVQSAYFLCFSYIAHNCPDVIRKKQVLNWFTALSEGK